MSKTELFAPEEIAIIQVRQLRKTIHYIYQRAPYYRDLFDRERLLPTDFKSLDDLRHLPAVAQEDLRRERDRFLCVRPEEVADVAAVAGAAAGGCWLKLTESDLSRIAYDQQLSAKLLGVNERDVVLAALPWDRCGLSGLACYLGLRRAGVTVLRMGTAGIRDLAAALASHQPTVLYAEAAYVRAVTREAESLGINLRHQSVRRLVVLGAGLRHEDGNGNDLGNYLARLWNAQTLMLMLSPETAASFAECETGCLHAHPEVLHVEVVDAQGRAVPAGEAGELCLTPFGVTGMPVLRFRTGELTTLRTGVCACGRWTPRIGPLLGRRSDVLLLAGRLWYPAVLEGVVLGEPEVEAYVFVADRRKQAEQITLWAETANSKVCARLEARFRQFAWEVAVRRASAKEIQDVRRGAPGGEHQPVIVDRRSARA